MARFKTVIDALTGEITIRPYTDEENAQADIDEKEHQLRIGDSGEQ